MNPALSLKEKLGSILKLKKSSDDDSDGDQPVADKSEKKGTDAPPPPPKQTAPAAKTPDSQAVKLESQIATLQDGLGRIESSITKAMSANASGFEENIKGLMQKLDDVVIAMQSTQSDKNSPFNSTSLVQELPESVGLATEEQKQQQPAQQQQQAQQQSEKSPVVQEKSPKSTGQDADSISAGHSNSLLDSIADVLQQQSSEDRPYREEEEQPLRELLRSTSARRLPLVTTRLQEFVKACALLEIVDGDHKRLNYLYDIGILRTEDLETASRIVDLLGRYSPNLKPVDLAIIACSIEETAASDRETRKLLAIATALNKSR